MGAAVPPIGSPPHLTIISDESADEWTTLVQYFSKHVAPNSISIFPRIDFEDYKAFEGITNEFDFEKNFLYFRSKIIILSSFDLRASRASIEDF